MRVSRCIRMRIDSPPCCCVRVRFTACSKPRSVIVLTSHTKHPTKKRRNETKVVDAIQKWRLKQVDEKAVDQDRDDAS